MSALTYMYCSNRNVQYSGIVLIKAGRLVFSVSDVSFAITGVIL